MGFFDDPNTAALLSAASGLFQAGAPSTQKIGLGQALGAGFQGYAGSLAAQRKAQMDQEEAKQMAQLRQLQILEATGSLEQKQAARQMAQNIKADLAKLRVGEMQPQAPAGAGQQGMASAAPGGDMSPKTGGPDWMQAFQQQAGGGQPGGLAQSVTAAAGSQGGNQTKAFVNRLLQEAEVYSRNGDFAGADQRYAAAEKLAPQFVKSETVQRNGRPVRVLVMKDGSEQVSDFDAAPDFAEVNLNDRKQFVDRNRLTNGQSFRVGMSPSEAANTGLARERFNFDKSQAETALNSPTYMDTAQGIMSLPKKLGPGQSPVGTLVTYANGNTLEKRREIPQFVVEGVTGNAKSLASINAALESLKTPAGKNAVGWKAYLPNSVLNRAYPDGTETRADIADIGSLTIHDRSGAAVTAAESPRLMPFIPLATDDAATVEKKLTRFKQLIEAENNNLTFQYPGAKKLADYAAQNSLGAKKPKPEAGGVVNWEDL